MRRAIPYLVAIAASMVAWYGLKTYVPQSKFDALYDQKLQLACFTAFLTVGSFLLAMKAFILVRLREDVYKHDSYRKRYLDHYGNKYGGDYYGGLIELGRLLVVSVAAAFLASVAQVTFGFSTHYDIKLVAPSSCVGVLVLVFLDWLFVCLNLKDWFEFIEEEAKQDIEGGKARNSGGG